MSAREKSDLPKVAEKRANKVASAAAEPAERRGGAKENAELQSTVRTQSRAAVSQAQSRIREAVIRNRRDKLTALLHHLTVDVLRASFFGLKKFAARVRERPRGEPRGSLFSRPNRSVSSAAIASDLYSEAGWQAAAARHRCPGGQDRPGGGGGNPDADL
jgi:hypothetical protein